MSPMEDHIAALKAVERMLAFAEHDLGGFEEKDSVNMLMLTRSCIQQRIAELKGRSPTEPLDARLSWPIIGEA